MQLSQMMKVIPIIKPQDITAGLSSDVVNMAKWNHLAIVLIAGAWAGGTAALTVEACDNNTPTTHPAMDFNYRIATMDESALSDVWGALTWSTSTGITLPNTANRATIIELDAAEVAANKVAGVAANAGYHRVRITIAAPSSADFLCAIAILSEGRYLEDLLKTAID